MVEKNIVDVFDGVKVIFDGKHAGNQSFKMMFAK